MQELLRRIGYRGPVRPDTTTLRALHRAWRTQVPYENLDIQLGRRIDLDADALLDKLVRRRRGGYCYEQNGGLALLLRAVGFDVTMMEGAVLRASHGETMWGNHNVLLVDVEGSGWVADAGIGDGFLEPLPLRAGTHTQGPFSYRLQRLDAETWRVHHHPGGTVASYDFRLRPRRLAEFTDRSDELSTSPDSSYVNTLIAGLPVAGGTLLLLSRTLRELGTERGQPEVIGDVDGFAAVLSERFLVPLDDLGPGGVERLWQQACQQHELWRSRIEASTAPP